MKNLLLITILATGLYASTPIETQIAQLKATQAAQAKEIARLRVIVYANRHKSQFNYKEIDHMMDSSGDIVTMIEALTNHVSNNMGRINQNTDALIRILKGE